MAWHDHWLVWFGTAGSYCLVRFLSGDRAKSVPWLYGAGLLIGLAGLSKYVALFLGLGWLVAIASKAQWRSLFWSGHLYGAIGLALLVMAPVLWWNAQHEWISFQFYLGRSVQTEAQAINWFGPVGFGLLSALIFGPVHVWLTGAGSHARIHLSIRRDLSAGRLHYFGNVFYFISGVVAQSARSLLLEYPRLPAAVAVAGGQFFERTSVT